MPSSSQTLLTLWWLVPGGHLLLHRAPGPSDPRGPLPAPGSACLLSLPRVLHVKPGLPTFPPVSGFQYLLSVYHRPGLLPPLPFATKPQSG